MTGSRKQRIAGWILSGLLALFLAGPSAMGKFADWEGKQEMFDHIGFSINLIKQIGILEIIITILYVIPRTGLLGAILLTGYLGGAIVTHLRVGDPFITPAILGVFVWIGLALRQPIFWRLAIGKTT